MFVINCYKKYSSENNYFEAHYSLNLSDGKTRARKEHSRMKFTLHHERKQRAMAAFDSNQDKQTFLCVYENGYSASSHIFF